MNTIYVRDGNVYETGIRGINSEPFIQSELIKNELNQLEMQVENLKEQKYNELLKENEQLKDNWNKLREWIVYNKHNENTEQHYLVVNYGTLLGKMQELEQGSDSNVKD